MSGINNLKSISALVLLFLLIAPAASFPRDNSLTGGLSVGLDYFDRSGDDTDDDYERIVVTPMILFRSLSERDTFELQASPSAKYDWNDSETDWDSNVRVAADRFMTEKWQLGISNRLLRSDYQDTEGGIFYDPTVPPEEVVTPTDPQLSSDRGRRRYWRNTTDLFSNHFYREDSLLRLGANYIALRNDDTGFAGDEDYDRYAASLRNEHRFDAIWSSALDLRYVVGDYEPADTAAGAPPTDDLLSDDLKEYYLSLALTNASIANNPLSLSYDYIATRYDETLQDDSDIHQMRLTWRRDISPRMYTVLGAGPSYEKTEGQDATWGGNGIAEMNYALEYGYINFLVEKDYSVDNFSGSDERGLVDSWETRLSGGYQLQQDLTLSGRLIYLYEDREEASVRSGNRDAVLLEEYHKDRYIAGAGLSYTFWEFYTASIDYTFIKQESDRVNDDYDDHRLLLTLSWKKELFHW
ncbi:hypothetical protein [Desulfocastanea catecholica]